MNKRQRSVVAVVAAVLAIASFLHGAETGNVLFALAVPALILGGFLYFTFGRESEGTSLQRVVPRSRKTALVVAAGLAVLLLGVELFRPQAPTAPRDPRLTPEELANVEGVLKMSGSQIEAELYNGTPRPLSSVIVRLVVYRDGEEMLGRRYLLRPVSTPFAVPPLTVGVFGAESGFYSYYTDSLSWSIEEARER